MNGGTKQCAGFLVPLVPVHAGDGAKTWPTCQAFCNSAGNGMYKPNADCSAAGAKCSPGFDKPDLRGTVCHGAFSTQNAGSNTSLSCDMKKSNGTYNAAVLKSLNNGTTSIHCCCSPHPLPLSGPETSLAPQAQIPRAQTPSAQANYDTMVQLPRAQYERMVHMKQELQKMVPPNKYKDIQTAEDKLADVTSIPPVPKSIAQNSCIVFMPSGCKPDTGGAQMPLIHVDATRTWKQIALTGGGDPVRECIKTQKTSYTRYCHRDVVTRYCDGSGCTSKLDGRSST